MFDDHITTPPQKGQVPDNLPIGEPEDIFAGTPVAPAEEPTPAPPPLPTALDAGVLRPVTPPTPDIPMATPPAAPKPVRLLPRREPAPAPFREMPDENTISEPGGTVPKPDRPMPYKIQGPSFVRTVLMLIALLVVLGAVIGGGWWIYRSFFAKGEAITPTPVPITSDEEATSTIIDDTMPADEVDGISVDESVLFGDVVDTDEDGLDDFREKDIGTDIHNPDTDSDGLRDFEEVSVWKTDPLETDSDGDGFGDGEEVKNGYNPSGPGRIFQPPTTTLNRSDAVSVETYTKGFVQSGKQSSVGGYTAVSAADDCGTAFSCFISRARTCQKAGMEYVSVIDLTAALGVTERVRQYAEIRGPLGASDCQVYFVTEEVALTFASDVPNEVQVEQLARADMRSGEDGLCTFETAALIDLLEAWSAGEFRTTDLAMPSCVGSMFDA